LKADTRANSEASSEIPHATEQGIVSPEQGILAQEQGIFPVNLYSDEVFGTLPLAAYNVLSAVSPKI
jgi:hypothetical protein